MRKIDIGLGHDINNSIRAAIKDAKTHDDECQFEFNNVTVVVAGTSDPDLIRRDWERGIRGYLGDKPTIGPYPEPKLTEAEKEADAAAHKEACRESEARQAEYEKELRNKRLVLQDALSNAGPLELVGDEDWDAFKEDNSDPYGERCVRYAEEWGRLIQVRINNGEALEDCADELGRLADDDGITGFMYGVAVSILAKHWKHGDKLRRWHNTRTQLGSEGDKANEDGGVLNPALLSFNR